MADPADQQTPEVIGSIYRNSTVLSKFRLDQEWIVKSLKYPCRHSFFAEVLRQLVLVGFTCMPMPHPFSCRQATHAVQFGTRASCCLSTLRFILRKCKPCEFSISVLALVLWVTSFPLCVLPQSTQPGCFVSRQRGSCKFASSKALSPLQRGKESLSYA